MKLQYYYISSESVTVPHFLSIGCSSNPKETLYGPKLRQEYLIHYVVAGKGSFNGQTVTAGQGFFITPGSIPEYHPDLEDPWHFLWFISRDPAIEHFFPAHMADPETGIFSFRNPSVAEQIFRELVLHPAPFGLPATRIPEYFLRIYDQCILSPAPQRLSGEKLYLEYAIHLVRTIPPAELTVAALCGKLGVSQPYLYRVFQKNLGVSPKQYILQLRLDQSRLLLRQTRLSVTQVASSVGFSDRLSFSRFFSAREGCSPTDYRSRHTSSEADP